MTRLSAWRHGAAAFLAGISLLLAACNTPPAFQVSQPSAREGKVVSITQDAVQNVNTGVGTVGGAVLGGAIGSLFGGGKGQTVATVVGAAGGGYLGNQAAQNSRTNVWRITVRYDDGTTATVQQTSPPAVRIGDRVRVSSTGIEQIG